MKKLLLLLFAFISSYCVRAQDKLTKKNGEVMQVKVLEITPDFIKYKRFDNLEGPAIAIQLQDISEIKYENGLVEKFDLTPKPIKTEIQKPGGLRKNALAVNILPILFQSFNVFYDHRLESNPNIGLSFGLGVYNHRDNFFWPAVHKISLTGAAKFYIQQSDFYLSPYLKYRHVSYSSENNWNQFGGGATFGSRHIFKSGILIDTFLGLGGYSIQQNSGSLREGYFDVPGTLELRLGVALGYAF